MKSECVTKYGYYELFVDFDIFPQTNVRHGCGCHTPNANGSAPRDSTRVQVRK